MKLRANSAYLITNQVLTNTSQQSAVSEFKEVFTMNVRIFIDGTLFDSADFSCKKSAMLWANFALTVADLNDKTAYCELRSVSV
jgi:hypothetical protein